MKDKITIGLFNDSFYPMTDGVINVVDNYARLLSKRANVIVFVPSYLNNYYDDTTLPYKVVRCKSIKIPFLDYSLPMPKLDIKFLKELKKYNLDIVHIHSPFTIGATGVKYAKKHNIPCIATMHSQFKKDIMRFTKSELASNKLLKEIIKVFNSCDECFAVNKEVARIFYEDYHCKKYPLVMNNATNMKKLDDFKKASKYINKKHNIKSNEKVFLFVGRLNLLKNILFIVDSLAALKEKRPKLKFKMLFVGSGQDEDKLVKRINKLKLEKDIILCGKIMDRTELACYYARADLFLFPSTYDASSIVQIEAASQETPTIFLKNTATASTVIDNVNGYISENSTGAFSDKIIDAIEDKKSYEKICKNAYIDLYKTWDETIDKVYDAYIDLINNK